MDLYDTNKKQRWVNFLLLIGRGITIHSLIGEEKRSKHKKINLYICNIIEF